jgi:mono/diheme cytochrome c family protein
MRASLLAIALGAGATVATPLVLADERGAALFAEHCVACHDVRGAGVPGFGTPLAGPVAARYVASGGRDYLAQVVVHGISGIVSFGGQRQFAAMPSHAKLSDDDLARVLNHVLGTLNATALPPRFEPIASADIAAARSLQRTPGELHKTKAALERNSPAKESLRAAP